MIREDFQDLLEKEYLYFQKLYLAENISWIKYLISLSVLMITSVFLFQDQIEKSMSAIEKWISATILLSLLVSIFSGIFALGKSLRFYYSVVEELRKSLESGSLMEAGEKGSIARQIQIYAFFAGLVLYSTFIFISLCCPA